MKLVKYIAISAALSVCSASSANELQSARDYVNKKYKPLDKTLILSVYKEKIGGLNVILATFSKEVGLIMMIDKGVVVHSMTREEMNKRNKPIK